MLRWMLLVVGLLCGLGLFVIGMASIIGEWTAYDTTVIDDGGSER